MAASNRTLGSFALGATLMPSLSKFALGEFDGDPVTTELVLFERPKTDRLDLQG